MWQESPELQNLDKYQKIYLFLLHEKSKPTEYLWLYRLRNLQLIFPVSFIEKQKVVGEKVNAIKQFKATEQTEASAAATISPSPEIIIKDEETITLNERLAQEIIQSGIECNAIRDIGSYVIEKQPYYSSLFAMSPTIVTNRGCIRLEGNGRRNIDFIQIIQKNQDMTEQLVIIQQIFNEEENVLWTRDSNFC